MAVAERRPLVDSARRLAGRPTPRTRAITAAARTGLAAQALVYILLGWLAVQIAVGHSTPQVNQTGALADVVSHPGGVVLVALIAAGFGCYALWRLSEAVFGSRVNHTRTDRWLSGLRALAYAALSVTTVLFLVGDRHQDPSQQQQSATARLMHHTDGRLLVGAIGLVVAGCGFGMLIEAFLRRFERQIDRSAIPQSAQRVVVGLGVVGSTARSVIVILAGGLIVDAAVTADPQRSRGLDGAFRTLAQSPGGPWLLGAAAAGFVSFGLYAAATARWVKT